MAQKNEIAKPRTVPLILGAVYQLIPSMGGQYVVLAAADKRYVYAKGFENHIADIKVRRYRWPEIVVRIVGRTSEGRRLLLLSGKHLRLMGGGNIRLFA